MNARCRIGRTCTLLGRELLERDYIVNRDCRKLRPMICCELLLQLQQHPSTWLNL